MEEKVKVGMEERVELLSAKVEAEIASLENGTKGIISNINSQDNEMDTIKKILQNSDDCIIGTGVKKFNGRFKNDQPLNILTLDEALKVDTSEFWSELPSKEYRIVQLNDSMYRIPHRKEKRLKLNIVFKSNAIVDNKRLNIVSSTSEIGNDEADCLYIETSSIYKIHIISKSSVNYCDVIIVKNEDTLNLDDEPEHTFNMIMYKDENLIITEYYCKVVDTNNKSTLNNCRSLNGIKLMVRNDNGDILPSIDEV